MPPNNSTPSVASDVIWNVPNVLSMLRLVFAAAVFVLLPSGFYLAALVMFVVSALTDLVDGWWARRFQQITKLGRVLDPFCDKVLICGTFILLSVESRPLVLAGAIPWWTAIAGWMAVVVVVRELLVTALRSSVEGAGGDFSAKMAGKLKMVFQCAAAVAAFLILSRQGAHADPSRGSMADVTGVVFFLFLLTAVFNWVAVLSTIWSGWGYVVAAMPSFSGSDRKEG